MAEFIRIPNDKKGCLELLKRQAKKPPDDHHHQAAISSMEATLSVPLDQKLSTVVVARISSLTTLLNHPGVRPDEILNEGRHRGL
ncbi:hypothetical protein MMC31_005521 [Peltigera leucophlebia]|nr:hypothetical protein [Peltigera leucophlebia]